MKIGIDARVAAWHTGSGIGNYTDKIIENLNTMKSEDEYIIFLPESNLENECVHLTSGKVRKERKKDYWKLMYDTAWCCNDDIDIFHNTVNGIGLPASSSHKIVITIHDLIPYIMPETVDKPHLKYVLKYTPEALEKADKIITVSYHSKNDIMRYFDVPEDKIHVIYHAADDEFKPIDKFSSRYIVSKNYNITDKFILYLGGFSPRKNIERLIYAFEKLNKELKEDYRLVILGEPSRTYDGLLKLCQKLNIEDKVMFTGFVPAKHLPFFYNACEAFVYPSLYEGFGLPPLEAAACGTPVITSNISSIPEIMNDSCIYVNPYDVLSISQGIFNVLSDSTLKHNLSWKGLKHSQSFSWSKAANETMEVYNSLK